MNLTTEEKREAIRSAKEWGMDDGFGFLKKSFKKEKILTNCWTLPNILRNLSREECLEHG